MVTKEIITGKKPTKLEKEETVKKWNYFAKDALQGVVRLGISAEELDHVFTEIYSIYAYVITYEQEPSPHLHFMIMSYDKKLFINPIRNKIKERIAILGKDPKIYSNGMLNLSRVKNPYDMLTYIVKSYKYEWFRMHCFNMPLGIVEIAKENSYLKVSQMKHEVKKIENDVKTRLITPIDATVKYVLVRKHHGKPDINYMNFYHKMSQNALTDEELSTQIRDRLNFPN